MRKCRRPTFLLAEPGGVRPAFVLFFLFNTLWTLGLTLSKAKFFLVEKPVTSIWATMGVFAQHWEITGPFRLFRHLKAWATMDEPNKNFEKL